MQEPMPELTSKHADDEADAALLPPYNDVSGPVIVDQDGDLRFLSPCEEAERHQSLQRVVRERMLGLPRLTESPWSNMNTQLQDPNDLPLPRYSP